MDLVQRKYFVQIIEIGSLATASRQQFIAQPALSQQLAKREAEAGKPLLNPTPRPYQLAGAVGQYYVGGQCGGRELVV